MNTFNEFSTRTPSGVRAGAALAHAWRSLPGAEKLAVALCPWVATALLLAFAMACQASVSRGERLRAELRVERGSEQRVAGQVTVVQLTTTVPAGIR